MKKYDYLKILTSFNHQEYSMFYQLSMNEEYVAHEIYESIRQSVPGCSLMFMQTPNQFIQWFTFYSPENESLSYFDTKIIGHINRNKKWAEEYYGDLTNVDNILVYLIASWRNKTKTLKANMNMLQMIYHEYIRFLNTEKGQDFAYGKSLDWVTEDDIYEDGLYYEDKPYWETTLYREQQLLKFKKIVLLKDSKSALENLEMRIIWDLTFNSNGKFNLKEAERRVWAEVGKEAISHTALFKSLKKLRIKMLQTIYKYLDDDFDYFSNKSFEIGGQVMTFKSAIYKYLIEAKIDLELDTLNKTDTNIKVVDVATAWAARNGLQISTYTDSPNVLARVKGDSYGTSHKGWKLYFYKGGGYKDFYNCLTGYYKDFE